MRLSNRMLNIIKQSVLKSFGNVGVYLFGSRVDDTKNGGDIDIAIDCDLSKNEFKSKKIKFISSMVSLGFDIKIDVVPYNTSNKLLLNEIRNNSVMIAGRV